MTKRFKPIANSLSAMGFKVSGDQAHAALPLEGAPVKRLRTAQNGGRMEYFAQQLINGIALGSIYGLIAIGYTMVFGIIGMVNFAHGDVFMVSAFIAIIAFLILIWNCWSASQSKR